MIPDVSGGPKYRLLVIDDDPSSLKVVEKYSSKCDNIEFHGISSPNEALKWAKSNNFDAVIADYKMPEMNGIDLITRLKEINSDPLYLLMTGYAELDTAIEAVRLGLFDFLIKPFTHKDFEIAIKRLISNLELKNEITHLRDLLDNQSGEKELIGGSKEMNYIREKLILFAQSEAPALITGETGVGKELAARMLHDLGERREKPFVAINCSAFAETLLESELFGHEKGAFTGADKRRVGRLELAEEGTVFLDEISEIPQHLQVKLLRVLQEKEFERVGGNTPIKLKGRVVSASNRVLSEEIKKGRFREDLFYRLNTLHVSIPPLRERPQDIEELAGRFLENFSVLYKKTINGFEKTALEFIMCYRWPGNVRQLKSAIEYAVLCCRKSRIDKEDLPTDIIMSGQEESVYSDEFSTPKTRDGSDNLVNKISGIEKKEIQEALEKNKWNRTRTAKELGMTVRQLTHRIKKHKIG